jgi:thiol:disulfide interchange protein DsbC
MKAVKKLMMVLAGCTMTLATLASAQSAAAPTEKPEAAIKRALEATRADLKVLNVVPSEVPGLYAVQFDNGPMVYATADAKYFVVGDLFQIQEKGYINLTDEKRNVDRAKQLATVPLKDMIVFKPQGATKGVISVFTDVECPWCQRFHNDVPQLNALGIEVRYLAFPRAGIGSEDYKKMVTAWCAKDRQAVMTRYKKREAVPLSLCDNNPVAAQFQLGERMGVQGTPTMVTAKGELLPGYVPPAELAKTLGIH